MGGLKDDDTRANYCLRSWTSSCSFPEFFISVHVCWRNVVLLSNGGRVILLIILADSAGCVVGASKQVGVHILQLYILASLCFVCLY